MDTSLSPEHGTSTRVVDVGPYVELGNPFTVREATKLILLVPLAVLRIVLILAVLFAYAAISFVASFHAPSDRPFVFWRRTLVLRTSWIGKVVVLLLGFIVTVKGWDNYKRASNNHVRLLVFNHPSWVDTIILLYLFAPSGVSRQANVEIPIVGTIIRSFQNIYIPKRATQRALADSPVAPLATRSTTDQIADRLNQPGWPIIAIAPEGMTSNGRALLQFRSGAFMHGVPVLPVCISYQWRHLNPAWTLGSEPWHILRMLTQLFNLATVEVLPAYVPRGPEVTNPAAFASRVRHGMAAALGVPTIESGIAEYHELRRLGVTVNWCGKLVAPTGVLDEDGNIVQKIGAGEA